jgi:hypothetical protein
MNKIQDKIDKGVYNTYHKLAILYIGLLNAI